MNEELREQAVTYLLGELDAGELAEFERRLASDAALRDEVERLAPVARRLGEVPQEAWEGAEPPPLELPVGQLPAAHPSRARAGWRSRLTPPRLALAGAAAAAIFAIGLVLGTQLGDDSETDPVTAPIELRPLTGSGNGATATVRLTSDDPRTVELVVAGLSESAAGTYYELWLLGEDEIVSLGSFTVGSDGTADATITIPVDPGAYESFDISVEQEDGDPSHSGDSVLRGPSSTS